MRVTSDLLEFLNKDVLVLGCGNILYGDDGFGVRCAEKLQKIVKNERVHIVDAGVSAPVRYLCFIDENSKLKKIIVIDAIDAGKEPGTVVLVDDFCDERYFDTHSIGLRNELKRVRKIKDVLFIGCQVKEVTDEINIKLSPEVERAIDVVIDIILKEIRRVFYETKSCTCAS
mgnify:CR=1 FL=1